MMPVENSKGKPPSEPELSFEDAFQSLGQTVEALEGGELTLERATTLYEEGMKLVQICNQLLTAAELRVTQLKDSYAAAPESSTEDDPEPL